MLIQVLHSSLLARVGPVPPPPGLVSTDPGGRPASHGLSAWGLYPSREGRLYRRPGTLVSV